MERRINGNCIWLELVKKSNLTNKRVQQSRKHTNWAFGLMHIIRNQFRGSIISKWRALA